MTFLNDDGYSLNCYKFSVQGEYFVVQGPTIVRFPTEPTNNAIHNAVGGLIGDVKYKIAAEAVCTVK